jgi:hypothetical protein
MLIYINADEELLGRALVWEQADGTKVMDRIYGSDHIIRLFQTYAKEQGWYYRRYNSFEYPTRFMTSNGREVELELTFPLQEMPELSQTPYMDTLKYINLETHTVTNVERGAHAYMQSTRGDTDFTSEYFDHDLYHKHCRRRNYHQIAQLIWDAGDQAEAPAEVVQDVVEVVAPSRAGHVPSGTFIHETANSPTRWYHTVNAEAIAQEMATQLEDTGEYFRRIRPVINFSWSDGSS